MLQPIRDYIVVSINKEEEKIGLLYKPTTVEQDIVTGRVLAVGSGHITDHGTTVALEVMEGNTVLFSKRSAIEVKHNGESFFIMQEGAVLSIVK